MEEQTAEKQAAPEEREPAAEPSAPAAEAEQPTLPGTIPDEDERLALLEAIVYVAEEPASAEQIGEALGFPLETVRADLERLVESYRPESRGVEVRRVAGGYKMFTKAQHHDAVRKFVKSLQPKLKLSPPGLETLAVIAYKQPVTLPEIQAIRGVNASGVVHTLLKHKLITTAGRKKVVGKPMMYKTTREFLVQFGLNDLSELPNLKELEELSRAALGEGEEEGQETERGQEARDKGQEEGQGTGDEGQEEGGGDGADAAEPEEDE